MAHSEKTFRGSENDFILETLLPLRKVTFICSAAILHDTIIFELTVDCVDARKKITALLSAHVALGS